MASANPIARRELKHRSTAAHVELTHNGAPAARAFAEHGTAQPGLMGGMAVHGFQALACTPLGFGPSRM
jgi:hypothetical protein